MTNRTTELLALGLALSACAALVAFGSGCSGEDEQPVVVNTAPPPPPPPPPPPAVTPVSQLMTEMNIDPRVSLPEEKAPDNDADRRAVLSFFDGFARGNDKAVSKMLPDTDRPQLAALVENGSWAGTTSHISKIDVQCGTSPTSDKCALAVIEVKGAGEMFQPQLWTYNTAEDHAVFDAVATPPSILDKLSGDWISRWYQILEEEVALASKADDEYTMAQRDLDTHASDSDTGGGGPGSGGPGKLRPPPAAPVDPPDIPGGGVTPGGGGRPGRP